MKIFGSHDLQKLIAKFDCFFLAIHAQPNRTTINLEDWFPATEFLYSFSNAVAAQSIQSDSRLLLAGAIKGSFVRADHYFL